MALKPPFAVFRAPALFAVALAVLSACGTAADDPILGAARGFASGLLNRGAPEAPTINPRQVLTRDIITQAGVPLILAENPGSAATMVRIATNGPNETWQGDGDVTLTLSAEGVLRATRGFGADLYASDIAGTRRALAQHRSGTVERLYVTVEGDLEQIRTGYTCTMAFGARERIAIFGRSHSVTRVTETCSRLTGESGADVEGFENRYWVDSTGFAWASEQWAGEDLGHFRIERLFR